MHRVLSVDPSICGVKFFSKSQVDTQPAFATVPVCRPQELEERPTPAKPAQPLLELTPPLLPNPGGGPRALLIGAPHNSEVTAVGGGADSPHVFLELLKSNKIEHK